MPFGSEGVTVTSAPSPLAGSRCGMCTHSIGHVAVAITFNECYAVTVRVLPEFATLAVTRLFFDGPARTAPSVIANLPPWHLHTI